MGQAAVKLIEPIDIRETVVDSARYYLSKHNTPEEVENKLQTWLTNNNHLGLKISARYRYPSIIEVAISGLPDELETVVW